MMELEHSSPFPPSEVASTSNFSEPCTVNAEQLATILSGDNYDCIVLDCRPPGTLPVSLIIYNFYKEFPDNFLGEKVLYNSWNVYGEIIVCFNSIIS